MKILVLNCGSSSIKYQMLDMTNEPILLAKGIVERIGMPMGLLKHEECASEIFKVEEPIPDHPHGIKLLLAALTDQSHGVIEKFEDIDAVGHRVAHGGEYFSESALIDSIARANIEKCCGLAPLHNPANLKGIDAMTKLLPNIKQVAVFDTSFHQTMPDYVYHYPIPYKYYENNKIRRYGFHGTSHKFVAEKACKILGWEFCEKKIITCHLGNGASICAIENGKSLDTSMGFTPVEGLMMGTRAGDLDSGALLYIMETEGLSTSEANALVNKKSGLQGFSEISSDMRDLTAEAEKGNKRAELTLEMFAYRVRKYIGAYTAAMDGLDLIIFTGGIGENACAVRELIASKLSFLKVDFDDEINKGSRGMDLIISKVNSPTKVMVVTTNEELVIANDTKRLVLQN
jgi:acetate kinase